MPMKTPKALANLSSEEVRTVSRSIVKKLAVKIVTTVIVTVAATYISAAIMNKIDGPGEIEASPSE